MIVCHCHAVSDRTIRQAVREGADNRLDVGRHCEAGTACRGCHGAIDEIVEAERTRLAETAFIPLAELAPAA